MAQQILWYASTALAALSVIRIAHLGLLRKSPYSAFAAMQIAMVLRDVLLFFLPVESLRYTLAWEATLPLVLVAQACAGIACYRAITALYHGIGRFAVCLFAGALILSAVASFGALPFELAGWRSEPIFRSLLVCYRWTETLLAGGLILAVAFLSRFPSPLRKLPVNLFRHTTLLAAYFSLYAITYFLPLANTTHVDTIRMVIVCLLYCAWPLLLSRRGEESEAWPRIDAATSQWLCDRNARVEALYHRAATENLGLQVGSTE